jgi:hypothetical protein
MSETAPELESSQVEIDDLNELLFRQPHPKWVDDDGVVSSQAFRPTDKDNGELSVARESLTTAEKAYIHYVHVLKLESAGTWAISVAEALDVGLRSVGDPIIGDDAHAFVDFRGLGGKACEKKGKLLKARAQTRGCLYAP